MRTVAQMRGVQSVTGLTMQYQGSFDSRWADAVGRLQGSRADLGRIMIVVEDGCRRDAINDKAGRAHGE